MLEHVKKGNFEYFAAAWGEFPFLVHAFCTRRGGVSGGAFASLNMSPKEGDPEENVNKNLSIVAEAFGISRDIFFQVHQVHGDRVLIIDAAASPAFPLQPPSCDALITNRPGLALCVKTADCVPLLMADTEKRIVAAVHAGWRGTALNIAGKVLRTLVERYGTRPRDVRAAIGPAIGGCCYEVDGAVYGAMASHPDRDTIFVPHAEGVTGKWKLDLALANRHQLQESGIPEENIHGGGLCTSCRSDRFYSHRKEEGMTGRLLNFIMLNDKILS